MSTDTDTSKKVTNEITDSQNISVTEKDKVQQVNDLAKTADVKEADVKGVDVKKEGVKVNSSSGGIKIKRKKTPQTSETTGKTSGTDGKTVNNDNSAKREIELTMGQYGYPLMTFRSAMRSHTIVMELDVGQRQALVNTMDIKHESPTELALLLKRVETELQKVNITTIVQQVTYDDWKSILKGLKMWTIVVENKEQGFLTITCPLSKFALAVMTALGFESPKLNY
ncbi:hypothetical protein YASMINEVIRUS_283 [Yasminevirus sp. GU-2018]|uniref:Uncharacterized protein n=1 Tax=Yasminevirus sp. GU-2018 TaxID=2420051 RepID=A0A5K0U7R2_9VIRU|nr:hypothetical protein YASMINEVIRUS_283 [Yasminevirus sp. GU-2018]